MSLSRPVTWTISLLLLGLVALGLSRAGTVNPVRDATDRVFAPVEAGVHAVVSPMADFITNVGNYGSLKKENQDLRAENERLSTEVTQLREAQAQVAQTSALNQSAQLFPNADFATASVIARDPSNVHDSVLIDKGTNDNVRTGMIVIGRDGALVGTVTKAQGASSWVRLITDPDSDVNAEVQETRAMAIVTGALGHTLGLQFVASGTDVKTGDTVITSGLGGNYPKALLIGRVSKVAGGPLDLFKRIQIEPAVRPGTLESVLVMTSFTPARSDSGQ
ncbi:MAG: rod shape-determining protein MreC [Dehalococcoidia bacterium]